MTAQKLLLWTPRALSVAFTLFIAMFALDVFSEGTTFWKTLVALAIHLIPAFLVLAAAVAAWRWAWVGAAGFAALGGLYAATRGWRHPSWILIISGPLFVIAALFFFSWRMRRKTGNAELRH